MKFWLKISVVANLVLGLMVLGLGLWCRWLEKPGHAAVLPGPATEVTVSHQAGAGETPTPGATTTLRWSQLESSNYRTYMANLRAIGCPPQTIRDIIAADVHSLYASRARDLESSYRERNYVSAVIAQPPEAELKRLREEERAVILALLGPGEDSSSGLADFSNPAADEARSKGVPGVLEDSNVSMPLVFQDVDGLGLELDVRQLEVLDRLRASFREAVGSPADPRDPAYLQRWQTAQRESDDLLSGFLGGEFYVEYQLRAGQRAGQQGAPAK